VEIATDFPRAANQPHEPGELAAPLDAAVAAALAELAAAQGTSLFCAGAAVFQALLYRHTQQSELAVAGWEAPAAEEAALTGPRAGVLAVALADEASFLDLLAQLKRALPGALARPAAPGAAIGAHGLNLVFGLARGGAMAPLADAVDLALTLAEAREGLELRLGYNRRLFKPERMREWLGQYQALARQVAAAPAAALLEHSLVTESGRSLLPDPTQPLDKPRQRPIGELVLDWAERTPDAPAIAQAGKSWSYGELGRASGQIAAELRAAGVGSGDVVAVTGERSFALVSAMLGVFRSGGALLTLDPRMPAERRKTMIEQAAARAVVFVGQAGTEELVQKAAPRAVRVDAGTAAIAGAQAGEAAAAHLPAVDPEQPAYVFFTSGSTGVPKAVLGRHQGLAHFLGWQRATFDIQPSDRASQLTALSFDVVLRDMFLALTSGATLCIPAEGDVIDPSRILTWLAQERVSVLHVVPSLARLWLNHVPAGLRLPALRRVFFAGEPLMDVLIRRFREALSDSTEVINLYGPTETTLAKCFHRVGAEPEAGVQPIGRPMTYTQALILNKRHRQCGVNELGQIAIRTPFRTFGYLNNAEANARAFIQNPFRAEPDDLVYLTGDSGRIRSDGLLEILGRMDNQVKIRGVRIEPGEIEAALGHHPGVREAVVAAREDAGGNKMLVAWVVARAAAGGHPPADLIPDLRRFLRARLPEAMVPSAFVAMPALPLNANGKVDKKALPAPDRAALAATEYAAPEDPLQESLARIWQRLLKLERVGIDDAFFDVGGHSLLAVQLVNTIEQELRRACTLDMLYRGGSIRALAAEMGRDAGAGAGDEGTILALQPAGEGPPLFCICGVHLYGDLARALGSDIPVYGIYLPLEQEMFRAGPGGQAAGMSIEEVAAGYLKVVRAKQPRGPYCFTGVSFGGVVAFEMAQQLLAQGEEVGFLAILDSMLPTALKRDWTQWTLAQVRRVREQGLSFVAQGLARRLGWKTGEASERPAMDPAEAEARRLDDIRARAYKAAELRYAPRPYRGPAILVRAQEKRFQDSDVADRTYGWGALSPRLETCDVPGDHISILRPPNVTTLARRLRPALERLRARHAHSASMR
jgi:amino acid adenylation domain-containing protein